MKPVPLDAIFPQMRSNAAGGQYENKIILGNL
jgi:hypothetical protein